MANFIKDDCLGKTYKITKQHKQVNSGVECEDLPGICGVCEGHERMTELEILESEGSEMISSQKCIEKIETLKTMNDLCVSMLR